MGDNTRKIAELQLQLAVLEGKEWAIKHVLGLPDISIGDGEKKWKVEVTHVGNKPKGNVVDGEK